MPLKVIVNSFQPISTPRVFLVSLFFPLFQHGVMYGVGAGEDALANLSIEQGLDGSLSGHIRIRSATQGIALSLGDKISLAQKVV